MDQNQNMQQETALPQKRFKAFWPIMVIAVLSALVGGMLVWAAYNSGLDEQLNSLLPGSAKTMRHKDKTTQPTSQSNENGWKDISEKDYNAQMAKDWQTYKNDKYGFEFMYPSYFTEKSVDGKIAFVSKDPKIIIGVSTEQPTLSPIDTSVLLKNFEKGAKDFGIIDTINTASKVNIGGTDSLLLDLTYPISSETGSKQIESAVLLAQNNKYLVTTSVQWDKADANSSGISKISKQILSSFKFTN